MSKPWSFAGVWNEALDTDRSREVKARDYVWASELGRGYYDRYWKMHGRTPTTPPNIRAKRKFEAGNLIEWVMQQILVRAGVLEDRQVDIVSEDGPIKVSGRCDFIAGGEIQDIDLMDMHLPESFAIVAQMAIENLRAKFPEGLREQGLEIKSCSALMYERYLKAPATHHALQAYFYAHGLGIPYTLVYISRDDLRICEWTIFPNSQKWKALYETDLATMAEVYPLSEEEIVEYREPMVSWNSKTERFEKNFEVEYSLYLTDYGYDRPDLYTDSVGKIATGLNYVIKRIRAGKALTPMNIEKHLAQAFEFDSKLEQEFHEVEALYASR